MNRLPAAALALTALAGCARDDGRYPSRAARPIEKLGFAEPVAPPAAPAAADPALDATIAALDGRFAAAAGDFATDLATAKQLAGRPGARTAGSDAWLDAQSALATLDGRRADIAALLGQADDLAGGRAAQLQPDYPGLAGLRDRIAAENDRESDAIARLQASLPAG